MLDAVDIIPMGAALVQEILCLLTLKPQWLLSNDISTQTIQQHDYWLMCRIFLNFSLHLGEADLLSVMVLLLCIESSW
jgi:hypothetical protein